jgi:hypothetical protein
MHGQYIKSWRNFNDKEKQVRLIISRIHRSIKKQEPYLLTPEEISRFNQAREAWYEFLSVARR